MLLGLLPLAALWLAIALLRRRGAAPSAAIVTGTLLWAYGQAMANEALSLLGAITFPALLTGWSLAVLLLARALLRAGLPAWRKTAWHPRAWRAEIRAGAAKLIPEEWILAVVLVVVGIPTLVVALVCPPNNWDSQVYHLPRIEHWIQDGSFAFYRTAISRQLEMPYLHELVLLQLRLLTGGDRLLNLVQWLAGAGSVFLVGRIALELGAGRRGIALARLTAATLPIGILEASSTQNDLAVSFFVLCMAERLLVWRRSGRGGDAAGFAIATGLALATKATAYLAGLPLGLWFLAGQLRRGPRALPLLLVCGLLLLLPNLPNYLRNLAHSGAPLGYAGLETNNATYGISDLVVNGARSLAVNLATENTHYNRWLDHTTRQGLGALGLDADDPDLTFVDTKFMLTAFQNNEDFAANPAQIVLGIVAVIVVLLAGASGHPRRRYALCVLGATLLFLLVVRWQPWITRLQLPLFLLAAPLTAFLLFGWEERRVLRWRPVAAMAALAIVMLIFCAPALWTNMRRPLFPGMGYRGTIWDYTGDQILFAARPDLQLSFQSAAVYAALHGDSQIGFVTNGDGWEYPLWPLLRRVGIKHLRLEHVGVKGAMAKPYPLGPFDPTIVFVATPAPPEMTIDGAPWHRVQQYPALSLYRPGS